MKMRLTNVDKWEDAWFQELQPKLKLFWLFLLDRCDNAGVWKINPRLASFMIGEEYQLEEVLSSFTDRLFLYEDKLVIRNFVRFQTQGHDLSGESPPIKNIKKLLKKHRLLYSPDKGTTTLTKGNARDKDKTIQDKTILDYTREEDTRNEEQKVNWKDTLKGTRFEGVGQ